MTRFEIVVESIEAEPWRGVRPADRLGRLLKSLQRSYGFKAIRCLPAGERGVALRVLVPAEPGKPDREPEPKKPTYGRMPGSGTLG